MNGLAEIRETVTLDPPGWVQFQSGQYRLIDAWREFERARGRSERTTAAHEYWLGRVIGLPGWRVFGRPVSLLALDESAVVAYLATLAPRGSSRVATIKALRSFYAWAHRNGHVATNPVRELATPRAKLGPVENVPTRDELIRLLIAATYRNERRAWAILLAASTGARRESLCSVEDRDIDERRIWFRVTKNDRPYEMPLSASSRAAIEGLRECPKATRGPHTPWRDKLVGVSPPGFWLWVNEASRDARLRINPHGLRHFFATTISVTGGADLARFMVLMNHQDPQMMRRYTHPGEEDLRELVELI